ncbi:alcohol dehydrogenase catalytic domain-containing protein [Kushneria phosphatilytica]|uniref:alcohol dehydrogenase catalytic domain-containing protein n=1 Tax=Kushneria phosphatilytica TaxID=657387 RepID=UPI001F0A1818|nr:alcohol dehydrogenase catalytic domain-containing protein [Kushneria phosphatilytica]
MEGRTPPDRLPRIPGHQAVGRVVDCGAGAAGLSLDQRVGVGWIASACGHCHFCQRGDENLCPSFRATGRDIDGGYAEYMVVDARFVCPLPPSLTDEQAAPMFCAGAIGHRSLRLSELRNGQALGLTGFGGSAHLVLQLARYRFPDSPVLVFARDEEARELARQLGATWAGDIGEQPPRLLDAIIDTTPVWRPVIEALAVLAPGGRLVINAIGKEEHDLDQWQRLDYPRHLWMEKEIRSVANVTRRDISEFLSLAAAIGIQPTITTYPLEEANRALIELRTHPVTGARVLLNQ